MDSPFTRIRRRLKAGFWKRAGRVPHAYGSSAAKWIAIDRGIRTSPNGEYGRDDAGLDERVVEYPWLFERMRSFTGIDRVLDAGSVLNHARIIDAWRGAGFPSVSIVTLGYEGRADVSNEVRYEFADLRALPYRDEWFPLVISLSTLEHVGLDNAVYGSAAGAARKSSDPGAEAAAAVRELQRVTRRGGTLLLSVPFGARSNRGWFRVLDADDLARLTAVPGWTIVSARYFRALREGWRECSAGDAGSAGYNEPGVKPEARTAPAWVAAAEAVALVELTRA